MTDELTSDYGLTDAIESIRRTRSALAAAVAGIPGFRFRRPNDLSAALGLDPKLAWNLGRCLEEDDPICAAQFLPGPTGIKKFLTAADRRKTPEPLLDALRSASDEFNEVVRRHAGTRRNFNILMTANSTKFRSSAELEQRRRAFEGNSYIWGVHAQTIFRSNLVMPSVGAERWDLVTIRGLVDFICLRPNVAWRITQPGSVDSDRNFHHDMQREPLDPNASTHESGLPLMLDHCTRPIPKFRPVRGAFGHTEYEFISGSVGIESRSTCITGERLNHVEPVYRTDVYDHFCLTFPIRTPAQMLVFDLIIHRNLFDNDEPLRAELYSDLFAGGPGMYYEDSDKLPLHESVEYLGKGFETIVTPEIPRYGELLRIAMDRGECNPADYDFYRIRIEYPPIASRLMLRRPLPER